MRLRGTKLSSIAQSGGLGNQLWDLAGSRPSLDLRFADNKSLVDATTGQSLVTFSRASGGTYVDSQGVIRNAVTNLLLRSEEFDNASWTKNDGLTVTANQIAAPNGTQTADQLVGNGSATGYLEQVVPIVNGLSYTFSVYLKKRNTSTVNTLLYGSQFNSGGANPVATWNLDTGNASFTNGASGSMIAVGSGWYRCVMTATATTTNANSLSQWVRLVGNSGDCYLWGAQLEQSSTVGEYIPTTSTINSAPRFDHNPSTGESLGLLVEEQRSNLALNTVWAGGVPPTNWTAQFAGAPTVVTSNLGNADGGVALSFTCNASRDYLIQTVALAANTTYIFSVYVEDTSQYANASANVISLNNGPAGSTITGASGNPIDKQRVFCSIAVGETAGNVQLRVGLGVGSNATGTIVLSRPQLEAGAFPTSYIKTQAATATRAADVASITGTNFSSWYRQDEGTVFANFKGFVVRPSLTYDRYLSINSNDANLNSMDFSTQTASGGGAQNQILGTIRTNNVTEASLIVSGGGPQFGGRAALAYATNDAAYTINGATVVTDNTVTLFTATQLKIMGQAVYQPQPSGHIRRLTYWPQRLSNAVLQSITQ